MVRVSITVRTPDDARASIEKLRAMLEASDISSEVKSFVFDASSQTLQLWQTQLGQPNTQSFKADKIFEGSDYRIVLKARSKALGIMGLLQRTFGAG